MLHLVGQLLVQISDARNHKHKINELFYLGIYVQFFYHLKASLLLDPKEKFTGSLNVTCPLLKTPSAAMLSQCVLVLNVC